MTRPYLPVLCLLACCLALTAASCPLKDQSKSVTDSSTPVGAATATGSTTMPQPPQRAYHKDYGVAIITPADWTIKRRSSNPVLFAMAPGADDHGPIVNVVVENINQRMAAYDYLQANIITMRVSLPGLEVKQGGVEPLGEGDTAWLQYTYPRGEAEVEAVSYCQTRDYRAYVVTAMAPKDMFEEYEALFRTIARSLRID